MCATCAGARMFVILYYGKKRPLLQGCWARQENQKKAVHRDSLLTFSFSVAAHLWKASSSDSCNTPKSDTKLT